MKRRHFISSTFALACGVPGGLRAQRQSPQDSSPLEVAGSCTTTSAPSMVGGGELPRYIAGLKDFEVRHLTGRYAPRDGIVSMYGALPQEWRATGQPNGADNVFKAWSGGAGDPRGRRLLVHGGGHGDSSNNGLYVYDFSGDDAPAGWSIAPDSLSARKAVSKCTDTYLDGKPTSIHTYDQLFYDTNQQRFYRFGGSPYCGNGAGMRGCFYYDFRSSSWVTWITSEHLAADLGATLWCCPTGEKLFYLSGTKRPFFVDVHTGTLIASGSTPFGTAEAGPCSVYDSKRNRWVVFFHKTRSKAGVLVVELDWDANTWSYSRAALIGDSAAELNSQGQCVLYDALRDSFWSFAGRTTPTPTAVIHEVDAATFEVARYPLSEPIPGYPSSKGGYNRHVWFEDWRIVGTVHRHDSPVSLIKLPVP